MIEFGEYTRFTKQQNGDGLVAQWNESFEFNVVTEKEVLKMVLMCKDEYA
jgi:hypothetical protein